MMKARYAAIPILVLAGVFLLKRSPEKEVSVNLPKPSPTALAIEPGAVKKAEPVMPAVAVAPVAPVPSTVVVDPELKPQLESFVSLRKKVLKTEDEKATWSSLLKNPHAVYRARKLLLTPTRENADLQNQAVEFLISAAKEGNPNAQGALESLVADSIIEGANADRATQQFKAELKAIALYEMTSHNPSQEAKLVSLLPGPVSKKIWNNVLAQQENNISEGEQELSAN